MKLTKTNWYPANYPLFIQFKLIQSKLIYFNYYEFNKDQFLISNLTIKLTKYNWCPHHFFNYNIPKLQNQTQFHQMINKINFL